MNKLSSCELYEMVNASFKGSFTTTLESISKNIDKYIVETKYYDFMVKSMRSYKYPLSKLIVKSALNGEIRPLLLQDPKDQKDPQIFLPSAIPTFSTSNGVNGYVDISPRSSYTRDSLKNIDALKIKEVELYAYLQMAFLDAYLRRFNTVIDSSSIIVRNVAAAYSRLFSRCIDRTFPISANPDRFNVSVYLSALFCLVQFFGKTIHEANNIIYASKISERSQIESDCKIHKENKIVFTNLTEFLAIYSYEFSDYIKEGSLSIRLMVNMFQKMYGANSWFALEHAGTFFNMILSIPVGLFNDKYIAKTIKAQVDKINGALVTTFSSSQ